MRQGIRHRVYNQFNEGTGLALYRAATTFALAQAAHYYSGGFGLPERKIHVFLGSMPECLFFVALFSRCERHVS